ncbi:MAG: type II toxin-antitoxin system HigB family toxin [Chitinophagaceae bacterium]
MRVHLIKQKTIDNYVLYNANGQIYFDEWLSKLKAADWESPADIKSTYHRTDLLGNGSRRVIFNIGGNNYRLICKYAFGEMRSIYSFAGLVHMLSISGCV